MEKQPVLSKAAKAGGGADEVMLELTVEQFYEFLAQMERVKASVDFLSG